MEMVITSVLISCQESQRRIYLLELWDVSNALGNQPLSRSCIWGSRQLRLVGSWYVRVFDPLNRLATFPYPHFLFIFSHLKPRLPLELGLFTLWPFYNDQFTVTYVYRALFINFTFLRFLAFNGSKMDPLTQIIFSVRITLHCTWS